MTKADVSHFCKIYLWLNKLAKLIEFYQSFPDLT